MEKNVIQLSSCAIREIRLWREYAKNGVSFEKLMISTIKDKVLTSEHSVIENTNIRNLVEDFIFFNDILNSLLEAD